MDTTCPSTPASSTAWNRACSSTYAISDRLSDFSQWRGSLGNDGAGLWHLMTQCKYVDAKATILFYTFQLFTQPLSFLLQKYRYSGGYCLAPATLSV